MTLHFSTFTCYLILVANHQLVPDGPYPVKDPSHVIHFELRSQTAFKLCDSSSLLFLFTKTLIKKDYFPFNISVKYFNFITLKIETSGWERLGWKQWMMECRSIQDLSRTFCWLKHSWRCEDHVHYQIRGHCSNNWMYGLAIMPIYSSLC